MNLPYTLRLICLLAAATGLTAAALECVLAAGAAWSDRLLRGLNARQRERALFAVQAAPAAGALVFAGAFCLPQYLLREPHFAREDVSGWCLLLAAAVLVWFGAAAGRGMRLALRTMRFARACRQTSGAGCEPGKIPVLTLAEPGRTIALVGLARPVILVSHEVRAALSDGLLDVALAHEQAHAAQKDNWKLLALHLLPRLPLRASREWMRQWQEAAEWAADEDAAGGSRARRLLLAETLVRVARRGAMPGPAMIRTALTCEEAGLAVRVARLVRPGTRAARGAKALRAMLLGAGVLALGVAMAAMQSPWIYRVGERILHLG